MFGFKLDFYFMLSNEICSFSDLQKVLLFMFKIFPVNNCNYINRFAYIILILILILKITN